MVAILISAIWKTHAPTSETEPSRGTRRAQFAKISWRTCCRGKSILYSIYNTRENRLCLIKFTVLYISLQIKCKTFTIVHVWIKVCIYGETHNVWDKIFQSLPIVCMLLSLLIIPFFFFGFMMKKYIHNKQQDIMFCIDWVLERKTERNGNITEKDFNLTIII